MPSTTKKHAPKSRNTKNIMQLHKVSLNKFNNSSPISIPPTQQ